MRESKRRDYLCRSASAHARDKQTDQKEQVIVAGKNYVGYPESGTTRRRAGPLLRCWIASDPLQKSCCSDPVCVPPTHFLADRAARGIGDDRQGDVSGSWIGG